VDVSSRVQQVVAPTPEPVPVREQTLAERKESVKESIKSIEGVMNSSSSAETSPQEQQAEKEAWAELLKALQQEKATLESTTETGSSSVTEPKPAKKN
jgi:beta-glucosidase-like glycosyl hydrolase